MATLQTSYLAGIAVGFPGMIANGESSNRISRTADEAMNFGQPAFRGAAAHTCQAGAAFSGSGVASAAAGNVGNGAMGAITVSAGAQQGRYNVEIVEPAANAGAFILRAPDGSVAGHGNVATAYSGGGLAFTLADGGTDFSAGDVIYIDVSFAENASFLGLTIADKTQPASAANPDQYPQYASVAIMTQGVMWVTAGATVLAGDPVYWNPSTSRFTKTATHIRIPNAEFDSGGGNGDLVKVAIRH